MTKPSLVVAVLKEWSFQGDRTIRGLISESKLSDLLPEGTEHVIHNFEHMTFIPAFRPEDQEYWLVLTKSKTYFKVYKSDQKVEPPL